MTIELTTGALVLTSDGKELGKIKKIEEGAFQLDVPHAFDFWLERNLVASADTAKVQLVVANSELGGYKMDRPNDPNGFMEPTPANEPAAVRDRTLRR